MHEYQVTLTFIHLHKLTAILFGFNNAIAHGMWSKARSIASLEKQLPDGPFQNRREIQATHLFTCKSPITI